MRSIGQTPEGLVFYLLFSSMFEPFADDDNQAPPSARTHPLSVDRLHAMTTYIRTNAESFARIQVDRHRATGYYLDVANMIETAVTGVLDDLGTQRLWRHLGKTVTPATLKPRSASHSGPLASLHAASPTRDPVTSAVQAIQATSIEGRWLEVTSGSHSTRYRFDPGGAYSYSAAFDIRSSRTSIELEEEGSYTTRQDLLTLRPTRKLYRKNGVQEPDVPKERVFRWAVVPDATGGVCLHLRAGDGQGSMFRPE